MSNNWTSGDELYYQTQKKYRDEGHFNPEFVHLEIRRKYHSKHREAFIKNSVDSLGQYKKIQKV